MPLLTQIKSLSDAHDVGKLCYSVSLQTLGTNSMIVKCKIDVYLMFMMLENCTTTETADVSLQTLGTKSMHSNTAVWLCTRTLMPVSPTSNKKKDL